MKKIFVNALGTIILSGVGCLLFKFSIEDLPRNVLDVIFSHIVIYVVAVISLLVMIDAYKRKNPYWWLWYLSVLVLLPIALPLYLMNRSVLR